MKEKNAPAPISENARSFGRAASALFRRNPILTAGILIGPVVAAAVNLKAAVALSIAVFVMVLPAVVVARLLWDRLPDWVTAIISVLISSALAFLAYRLISPISPLIFDIVGIYIPVLIIAPVSILGPGHDHFASKSRLWSIAELVFLGLGFAAVACLVGVIRELLSNFSVWGIPLGHPANISAATTVFAGFILLGFIAALFRALAMIEKRIRLWCRHRNDEKAARRLAAAAASLQAASDSGEKDDAVQEEGAHD